MTTKNIDATPLGLETVSGEIIGRDPRRMTTPELHELGHSSKSVLETVKAHCIECCGGRAAEARKCTATGCKLWAFRTGANPFTRRDLTEQQRVALRERAAAARASKAKPSA